MLFNCNDYFTSAIIILKPKQTVRIKLIKKFRYLSIRTTKTLIQNLFFTSDKIFGNRSKAIVEQGNLCSKYYSLEKISVQNALLK